MALNIGNFRENTPWISGNVTSYNSQSRVSGLFGNRNAASGFSSGVVSGRESSTVSRLYTNRGTLVGARANGRTDPSAERTSGQRAVEQMGAYQDWKNAALYNKMRLASQLFGSGNALPKFPKGAVYNKGIDPASKLHIKRNASVDANMGNSNVSRQAQKANASLTAGISKLKGSVSALQDKDTYADTKNGVSAADKTVSAVKDYVTGYNDVVNASKGSTLSRKVSNVASMMKSSQENADKLAEIGITIGRDGNLQLNEDKLKSADVSKVQELFSKENLISYGSTVMSRLDFASVSSGSAGSVEEDREEQDMEYAGASALQMDMEKLASDSLYEKVKDEDGTERYDSDRILAAAKSFAGNYNSMMDAAESSYRSGAASNLAQIREKTAQNKDTLEQLGISVDTKGRMKIDEDAFKKADMDQVQKFFKEYGDSIAENVARIDDYMTAKNNAAASGQGGFWIEEIMQ